LVVLAIQRANERIKALHQGLGNLNLRIGDVLMVQSKRSLIKGLKQQSTVMVLDSTIDLPIPGRRPIRY
jgi:uncharacterized protein with PhoU and TrkA domain